MNITELVNNITNDTNVHFVSFEQDKDKFIAKSHFFDLHILPTYLEITDSYNLPGPTLKKYLQEKLPFRIDFIVDNYYIILVETIDELYRHCLALEYKDEHVLED